MKHMFDFAMGRGVFRRGPRYERGPSCSLTLWQRFVLGLCYHLLGTMRPIRMEARRKRDRIRQQIDTFYVSGN